MCTVTWFLTPDGYELFMNRDELRRRLPASPPKTWQRDDGPFLAPRDGDSGGTWISVNPNGLGLTLLNRYAEHRIEQDAEPAAEPDIHVDVGPYRSRGLLVADLATASRPEEVGRRLAGDDLRRVRPFTLVAFFPGRRPELHTWDGQTLSRPRPAIAPLASSSYDPRGIGDARRRAWASFLGDLPPDRERLLAFHRSHEPARGPHSPCMHRDDACTVSFSWVRVEPRWVSFVYAGGALCRTSLGEPLILARHELALCV